MKRIEVFIGTEKDKANAPLSADVRYYALEHGRRLLADTYGGFTELPTVGGWKGPDGRVVTEAGIKYEVWIDEPSTLWAHTYSTAQYLRDLWHQSAVLMSVDGQGSFI